jgi:hypothetical protein
MFDRSGKQVNGNSALDGNNGQKIRQIVDVEESMEKTLDDNVAAAEEYDEAEEDEAVENAAKENEG